MKQFAKDLKTVARQLSTLSQKTEKLANVFEKTPPGTAQEEIALPVTQMKPAVKLKTPTPTDQVLAIMKRFKKGISVEALRGKSGLNEKQISNIVHRASQKGKMKRIGRGVYSLYDQ